MSDPAELTIADVAKAAGVSVSTVSRILNGKRDVAEDTRQRVQKLIEDLGYIPHAQAQRLRAGKTQTLALLYPRPDDLPINQNQLDFMIGAAAAANEHDFFFNLMMKPVTRRSLLSFYQSAQCDGLILMEIHLHDWRVELLRQKDYPFVMIGHCADNTDLAFIDLDFEACMLAAFDHLVGLGHRRIGYIALAGPRQQPNYGPAVRSMAGYRQALETYPIESIYRETSFLVDDIFEATLAMLDEMPDMTAIVTPHDSGTVGIIRALTERGRTIPDNFSLIGIIMNRIAELSTPPLTAVNFPSYDMGYQAAQMLIRKLEGQPPTNDQILIPPRLVIRHSTGPVPVTV
jgi:DNA-binding LacI/PurR family transcriptional regulator